MQSLDQEEQDYGVYDFAQQVKDWLADGRDVTVATVVATVGFSSRRPARSAAWTAGAAPAGEFLPGVAPDDLKDFGLVDVTISEDDATAGGFACGGSAAVLVQPAAAFPPELWDRLIAREPVCLVAARQARSIEHVELFTPETIRGAHAFGGEVTRLFGRGTTATAVLDPSVVITLWPMPRLIVMGDGLIADALRDAATLLDWQAEIVPEVQAAVAAVGELRASDALVVLSHDRAADGPTLAAALTGQAGYIGALGSRRTQIARREWLMEHGVPLEALSRIHGPAGLDIGAHTPGEIAVSIVAEILACRAATSGGALRDRDGPVHVAGVQAPPPRY
jgi:xanthine dehydrogenase accessory factor